MASKSVPLKFDVIPLGMHSKVFGKCQDFNISTELLPLVRMMRNGSAPGTYHYQQPNEQKNDDWKTEQHPLK